MKKIFGLPAILLPISLLAVGAFIGNSALDIKMNGNFYNVFSANILQTKFVLAIFISWILHIVLGYLKPLSEKWTWLQVAISLICIFIFYFSLNSSMSSEPAGGPRRYYEYEIGSISSLFASSRVLIPFFAIVTFYITQVVFWVYGSVVLVKSQLSHKKKRLPKQ